MASTIDDWGHALWGSAILMVSIAVMRVHLRRRDGSYFRTTPSGSSDPVSMRYPRYKQGELQTTLNKEGYHDEFIAEDLEIDRRAPPSSCA